MADGQIETILNEFLALMEKMIRQDQELVLDHDQLQVLGDALSKMAGRLKEGQKARALRLLLEALKDEGRPNPLCKSAVLLTNDSTMPMIVDLMKWPTCTSAQRDQFIKTIGELTKDTGAFETSDGKGEERVRLWNFAGWAEKQPYADLRSPPAETPISWLFEAGIKGHPGRLVVEGV